MTSDIASIALLSRILGELALISIIYGSICRHGLKTFTRQLAHGALFGAAAVVTTMSPIAFSNGIEVDGHIMMLAYSAAFGGPITFLVTVAISLAYKMLMSTPIPVGSAITVSVTGLVGLSWGFFIRPKFGLSLKSLVILGLMSSAQILLFFLLPVEIAISMILRTLPVGILIGVSGAVLMGKLIEREVRHIDLETRLASEASTDVLTGLKNRRAFEIRLEALDRQPNQGSVMVVDIDNFKTFNDSFGHDVGDKVLQAVGQCLTQTLAKRGLAYRTGGEEFTLVLPGHSGTHAVQVAEEIRDSVARLRVDGVPKTITVSLGIADLFPATGAMMAVRKADKALYVAKSAGRNRCVSSADLDSSRLNLQHRSVA